MQRNRLLLQDVARVFVAVLPDAPVGDAKQAQLPLESRSSAEAISTAEDSTTEKSR
jgi:hypothetical protein